MKQQHLKILRYNTGTDKKAFVQFKDFFDAAIFNATIVAYSGASVADLISMHSRRYIIDPQTHIFQQELSAYTTENKKTHIPAIKKSVTKYLEKMPAALADKILKLHQKPEPELIAQNLDALVECVYAFQTEFVNTFIVQKEYDKYLKFANMGPRPKLVIAPYFMIKSEDSYSEKQMWLHYNRVCLEKTIALNEQQKEEEIAAQLVLEKDVLSEEFIEMVASTYDLAGYEYIFIWLDDFNAFEAKVARTSCPLAIYLQVILGIPRMVWTRLMVWQIFLCFFFVKLLPFVIPRIRLIFMLLTYFFSLMPSSKEIKWLEILSQSVNPDIIFKELHALPVIKAGAYKITSSKSFV